MKLIPREEITTLQAKDLVQILNYDTELKKHLSSPESEPSTKIMSLEEFNETNKKWVEKTNSKLFIIVYKNSAIGSISLSHIKDNTARIGYWLTSKFWNKGLMRNAFSQILDIARLNNLKYISSTIDKDNTTSLKIWMKYNPSIEEKNDTQDSVKIILK